jgi:predicted metal-binding membrane protein
MNLAFMGLATFLMIIEKLPQYGRFLTMPLGLILIVSGLNLFIF